MKIALAFSGGKDSMACLHLMRDELDCAIYVDTGYTYPETEKMVAYASKLLTVHVVRSPRAQQNAEHGLPADVVPINWTAMGQTFTTRKPTLVQSYLQCCYENLSAPLLDKAHKLEVTHLVYGQRKDETHRAPHVDGEVVHGMVRLHPIENWTREQVLNYLRTKMPLPDHYWINHSSLDCYDCTAFAKESQDRVLFTKTRYPKFYDAYQVRQTALQQALQEAM